MSAILRDVLLGLDYLHSNRKCHRDLKSANVLLTKDKCKLADFGVSAELNETNELKSSIVGTLSFMAPEVLNTAIEEYAGWRADIWSLGCLCHELAVGYSPFKGYSFHEMMTCSTPRFENRKREKTDKHPNVWSDEIQDFLAVCCVADPLKRPGARDLLGHPFIAKYAKDATAILSTLYQEAKETVDRYKVCKKKHDFNPCSLRGEPYDDCARAFENSVNQYVFDNPTRPDFDDLNLGLLALASPHQQQGHFGQPQQRGSQRALGGESEFDMQGHRNRNAGETVDSIAGLFASPGGMGGLMIGNPNQPHQYQQQHNAGNNIDHDSFMNKSVEIGDGNFNIGNLNGNPGANLAAGNVGAFQGMTEATAFQVLPGNILSPQPSEIDPRSRPYEGTHSAAATVDQSDEYAANSFGFGLEGENDYRLQQQQQYQQMGLGLGVHSDTVRQVGSSLTVRMNDLTVDNDSVSGMSLSNTSHTASTRKNNDSCEISHGPV